MKELKLYWPVVAAALLTAGGFILSLVVTLVFIYAEDRCEIQMEQMRQKQSIDRLYTPPTWPLRE